MNAVDLQYICTHSGKKNDRKNINPANNLIRFEFMECLVRIAKDKYTNPRSANTENVETVT